VVEHDLDFFQEFSDIYGDTINDIEMAERFFGDFMEQTEGWLSARSINEALKSKPIMRLQARMPNPINSDSTEMVLEVNYVLWNYKKAAECFTTIHCLNQNA
jgi:hypothetical protein